MSRPFALLAAIVLAVVVVTPVAAQAKPRNVVVFLADDLGWRDLGYAGSAYYESPNIDALAARGVVFTNAYAACPVCSPTRAALLTGRYPARVGVTDYIGGPQPAVAATQPRYKGRLLPAPYLTHLPLKEVTVAEAFKEAGYATFFAGKWHLGREKYYPDKQGFDAVVGATWAGHPGAGGYFSPYTNRVKLPPGPKGEHLDLRLANETAKWIGERPKDEPFLAWFSLYDVHTPLMAPPETIEYFRAKRERLGLKDEFVDEGKSKVRTVQAHDVYAAMVKTMDDAVGVVVKQLESRGLLDDTVIVFTSDNGGLSTAEGQPTSNAPFRAGKGWAYEGGVRVPLVVVSPGITGPGSKTDARAISTDLFPTLLAACGIAPRPDQHVDGIDLTPALRGAALPERPLFWHYPHYGNQGGSPFSAIRAGDWKLIAFHDPKKSIELYNLANDPTEKSDLAKERPRKVQELEQKLAAWKQSVGAKDATPREADVPEESSQLPGSSRIILAADERYPRYSEGDVIELIDGRLLLAVGRKVGASDFARGTIVGMFSKDGGRTWDAEPHVIRGPFADRVDQMSVSLFRTPRGVHLSFLARTDEPKSDTLVYQILSTDEGKTWGEPTRVSVRPGYHVVNNARVVRTSKGRLLVPASYVERIDTGIKGRSVIVIYSDDDGVTWRESAPLEMADVKLMEPGVAECADGSLYMTIRTALGVLYEARSRDGGATWGDLAPTKLPAPAAPSTVVRAPDSDDLWMFWCNNAKADWKQRTPQVFARSRPTRSTATATSASRA